MFFCIMALNILSFTIVANANKHMVFRKIRKGYSGHGRSTTYLIPGMAPNNKDPFGWLLDKDSPILGDIQVLSFQNFGYNPRVVARQIERDIRQTRLQDADVDHSTKMPTLLRCSLRRRQIYFITVSMGAQVPFYVVSVNIKHIAISPCFGRQSLLALKPSIIHYFTIALKVAVLLLGWIAYLPIIKIGKDYYSSVLFADWLYWSTIDTGHFNNLHLDGLITGTQDTLVDNEWIRHNVTLLNPLCDHSLNCGHCEMGEHGDSYTMCISKIIKILQSS